MKVLSFVKTFKMRTSIAFLLTVVIACTASAQKIDWKQKDPTAEDFKLAEEQAKTGLGEVARVSFKFGPKRESPIDTYFEHIDGTSTHTWHQTVEKKGRLYINDSIASAGIRLKLYVSGHLTPTYMATIYRLEGAKVKKVKIPETSVVVKESNDTIYYHLQPGGFKAKDILEISYTIKTELNKAPIWHPINDISPRSISQLDFATPSWLKYEFQFEGIYEEELTKSQYSQPKTISVETWDSNNPDGSSKVALRRLRNTYTEIHDVFMFTPHNTKPKLFIATLIEDTKVNFR
jgi:hypothetical protein